MVQSFKSGTVKFPPQLISNSAILPLAITSGFTKPKKNYIGSILIVISITWANSSRCVDLPNGNLSDGNQVQILVCNGAEDNNTQIWDVGYM